MQGCWQLHFQFLAAWPAGMQACLRAVTSVLPSLWLNQAGKWLNSEGALAPVSTLLGG